MLFACVPVNCSLLREGGERFSFLFGERSFLIENTTCVASDVAVAVV